MDAESLISLPRGTTLYVRLRHVARTGMSRTLDAFVVTDGRPRRVFLPGCPGYSKRDGLFRVRGCGFNVADHLCRVIGRFVANDDSYFSHEWF